MASNDPWKKLQEEATCSICWKYYVDPCTLDCGHSFCAACVSQCWKGFPDNSTACPQCRTVVERINCCPNATLAKVVEIAKQLCSRVKEEGEREVVCEKHPEPSRTVFCVREKILFCPGCVESEQHRNHQVVSVEEAAQRYKNLYFSHIEVLKEQRAEMVKHKFRVIDWDEQLKKNCVAERETVAAGFSQLYGFLKNQERRLLMRLQSVPREIDEKRKDNDLGPLYLAIFSLETSIRQLEEKASRPVYEFLPDAMKTIGRFQRKASLPTLQDALRDMKWGFWEVREMTAMVRGLTYFFKDALQKAFSVTRARVTLDADSNHPEVFLPPGGNSMKWKQTAVPLPKSRKRFDKLCCVVGCREFTLGHHFWEVIVEGPGDWAVGVAKRSVKRKGFFNLCPREGIFALGKLQQQYRAFTSLDSPILPLDGVLRRIRVSLNCSAEQVSFYDVPKALRIYEFTGIGCFQEAFLPFFWLSGEIQLTIANQ